ncbi:hypothetical protein M758_11G018800 [Ceratodon purpureus]|nr:hypothetical protein M758_11G018800 [Ceratodon purpureus]
MGRTSCLTAVMAGILVCVAAVGTRRGGSDARGVTAHRITFRGNDGSIELSGVIYRPRVYDVGKVGRYPAVVMMHGCSGIWSERVVGNKNPDGTPNLQNNIEKWGIKLAESNVVALAVDSFTPRQPVDVTSSEEWQNQCSDNAGRYAGVVNPYTERVQDARAAWEYLNAMPEIDGARIGLLGWSHGAQSVMVEVAETGRDSDEPRAESDHKFVCFVAFYPGCGVNLGFGPSVSRSFWRPFRPMQLHMGVCDPFYKNCVTRKNLAVTQYSKPVLFSEYPGARHHFDACQQTWPTSPTSINFSEPVHDVVGSPSLSSADKRAMRCADIAALEFFLSRLKVAAIEDVKDAPHECKL